MDAKQLLEKFMKDMRHFFNCLNFGASALDADAISFMNEINQRSEELITAGRVSVLQDFDNMCAADAVVGFSDNEWNAVRKFFAWNKSISNWDKQ